MMRAAITILLLALPSLLPDTALAIRLERLTHGAAEASSPVWSSEPAWSPDSKRIAFTRAYYAEHGQGFRTEITVLSLDDRSMTALSIPDDRPRDVLPGQATWSPDGWRLAFSSQPGLALYDVRKHELDVVAQDHTGDLLPAWSPDGSSIAFQSTQRGIMDVWLFDTVKSSFENILARNAVEGDPSWSPDGRSLAISSSMGRGFDIWIVPMGKGYPRQLTSHPRSDTQPAWSPDGRFIVFVSDRDGSSDLWVIPASGGEATRLTWDAGEEVQPDWSPDGNSIVFTSNRSGSLELWRLTDLPPAPLLERRFESLARRQH